MNNSIKKLNKLVNADLKQIGNWLNVNKIQLNVKKTEMMIFKFEQKKFEGFLNGKLCDKRLYPTESVKYLGPKISRSILGFILRSTMLFSNPTYLTALIVLELFNGL